MFCSALIAGTDFETTDWWRIAFVPDQNEIPVSEINEMGQSEFSFPIFGGIDDNENGFDQSSDFPELVPEMNERIQSLCRTLDQVFL